MSTKLERIEAAIEVLEEQRSGLIITEAEAKLQLTTPDGIKFWVDGADKVHGLLFNDYKQRLGYSICGEVYDVNYINLEHTSLAIAENLPLVPCKYEDLKPGEFFYMADREGVDFSRIALYAVKVPDLNRKSNWYAYPTESGSTTTNCTIWNHYWKVGS